MRKYNRYIMLNIYPLRATKIDADFDKSCNKKAFKRKSEMHRQYNQDIRTVRQD